MIALGLFFITVFILWQFSTVRIIFLALTFRSERTLHEFNKYLFCKFMQDGTLSPDEFEEFKQTGKIRGE